MRTPTAMPAAIMLNSVALPQMAWTISGLIHVRAKNPSTTLGRLARISSIGLSHLRSLGFAYSDRYIAAPRPSGVATIMAMMLTTIVPATIVLTSKAPRRGNQPVDDQRDDMSSKLNRTLKKSKASKTSEAMMAALIAIDNAAAAWKTRATVRSLRRRAGLPLSTSRSIGPVLPLVIAESANCSLPAYHADAGWERDLPTRPRGNLLSSGRDNQARFRQPSLVPASLLSHTSRVVPRSSSLRGTYPTSSAEAIPSSER